MTKITHLHSMLFRQQDRYSTSAVEEFIYYLAITAKLVPTK